MKMKEKKRLLLNKYYLLDYYYQKGHQPKYPCARFSWDVAWSINLATCSSTVNFEFVKSVPVNFCWTLVITSTAFSFNTSGTTVSCADSAVSFVLK